MKMGFYLLLAACFLLCLSPLADAKSKQKKKEKHNETILESEAGMDTDAEEITIIRKYLGQDGSSREKKGEKEQKQKNLPPGLQKKLDRGWELPPGWQKKVQKGEVLPADLYEQSEKLPDDILKELPEQNDDVETVILESKVVKILKKTMEIIDVLEL